MPQQKLMRYFHIMMQFRLLKNMLKKIRKLQWFQLVSINQSFIHSIIHSFNSTIYISVCVKHIHNLYMKLLFQISDHETGGLSLARQVTPEYPVYAWYPEMLTRVKSSSYVLSKKIKHYNKADRKEYIKKLIENNLGIMDYTDSDIEYLNQKHISSEVREIFLANLTSHRAQLGVLLIVD